MTAVLGMVTILHMATLNGEYQSNCECYRLKVKLTNLLIYRIWDRGQTKQAERRTKIQYPSLIGSATTENNNAKTVQLSWSWR